MPKFLIVIHVVYLLCTVLLGTHWVPWCILELKPDSYTQSHIKSDQPGSHVFRWLPGQLSSDFYKIL